MVIDPKPLCVIPAYMREDVDFLVLGNCLRTLRGTAFDHVDVLIVDDGSPYDGLKPKLKALADEWDAEVHFSEENQGYSRTVNVGLQRALDEGRHAITVNADIEFTHLEWLERMVFQRELGSKDKYAYMVGAMLLFPNGTIQHAGIYLSLLTRSFDHLYKFSPGNLAEANEFKVAPVTGALQFIRHECLTEIGLYDEAFRMAFEDVDYNLRVLTSGHQVVFNPTVRAIHHESLFRGRTNEKLSAWTSESLKLLMTKWSKQSMAGLVPAF